MAVPVRAAQYDTNDEDYGYEQESNDNSLDENLQESDDDSIEEDSEAKKSRKAARSIGEQDGIKFDKADETYMMLNGVIEKIPDTMEFWLKTDKLNARQVIFGNYKEKTKHFSVELSADNKIRYYENDGAVNVFFDGDICTNEWTQIAIVRDCEENKIYLYVDGELTDTKDAGGLGDNVTLDTPSYIGTDSRMGMHFNGSISQIRLWEDMKTEDEIQEGIEKEIQGDEAGLMHCWILNDSALGKFPAVINDKAEDGISISPLGFELNYESEFEGSGVDFSDGTTEIAAETVLEDTPHTFEAWVKLPSGLTDRAGVIAGNYFDASYDDIPLMSFEIFSNGHPRLYWKGKNVNVNYIADNINICIDDWVHVAITYDDENDKASCYINGEKIDEKEALSDIVNINMPVKLGGDYRGDNTRFFRGEIADVRIWSTVRTDEEIKESYNNTLDGDEEGLLANWTLDNENDGTYADNSENGNNAHMYKEWLEPDIADGDYTIAVIPDTQYLAESYNDKFNKLTTWLKDNRDEYNIQLAVQLGDLVNINNDTQWQAAQKAMTILDGELPYVFAPGNHDESGRDTTLYNKYFPYSKYSEKDGFAGAQDEGSMDNTYHKFEINGVKFMNVCLEFGPNDDTIAWANKIISENPDYNVIISTHAYMYHNGAQINEDCKDWPSKYSGREDANDGDDMWEKLVSQHKNICLVLSGHIGYPDLVTRYDTGANGKSIPQVLCDSQYMDGPYNAPGMVMLMTFHEGSNSVDVNWYSTDRDKLFRDKNQYVMQVELLENSLAVQDISFEENEMEAAYGGAFTNKAVNNSAGGGNITYKSLNKDVAVVDENTGEVKIVGIGKAVIKATAAAVSGTYRQTSVEYEITAVKGTPKITFANLLQREGNVSPVIAESNFEETRGLIEITYELKNGDISENVHQKEGEYRVTAKFLGSDKLNAVKTSETLVILDSENSDGSNSHSGGSYSLSEDSGGLKKNYEEPIDEPVIGQNYDNNKNDSDHDPSINNIFTDVSPASWYSEAVSYVSEMGYMAGGEKNKFDPEGTLTRAMAAQILFKINGGVNNGGTENWYDEAVNWSLENSIAAGYSNGDFGADDSVTREQFAVMLYNYARYKGIDTSKTIDVNTYIDSAEISGWSVKALEWAVGQGIINGSDGKIMPLKTSTRAETAQMIMGFMKQI